MVKLICLQQKKLVKLFDHSWLLNGEYNQPSLITRISHEAVTVLPDEKTDPCERQEWLFRRRNISPVGTNHIYFCDQKVVSFSLLMKQTASLIDLIINIHKYVNQLFTGGIPLGSLILTSLA